MITISVRYKFLCKNWDIFNKINAVKFLFKPITKDRKRTNLIKNTIISALDYWGMYGKNAYKYVVWLNNHWVVNRMA